MSNCTKNIDKLENISTLPSLDGKSTFIANKSKGNHINLRGLNSDNVINDVILFAKKYDIWSFNDNIQAAIRPVNYVALKSHDISFVLVFYNQLCSKLNKCIQKSTRVTQQIQPQIQQVYLPVVPQIQVVEPIQNIVTPKNIIVKPPDVKNLTNKNIKNNEKIRQRLNSYIEMDSECNELNELLKPVTAKQNSIKTTISDVAKPRKKQIVVKKISSKIDQPISNDSDFESAIEPDSSLSVSNSSTNLTSDTLTSKDSINESTDSKTSNFSGGCSESPVSPEFSDDPLSVSSTKSFVTIGSFTSDSSPEITLESNSPVYKKTTKKITSKNKKPELKITKKIINKKPELKAKNTTIVLKKAKQPEIQTPVKSSRQQKKNMKANNPIKLNKIVKKKTTIIDTNNNKKVVKETTDKTKKKKENLIISKLLGDHNIYNQNKLLQHLSKINKY